MSRLFFRIVNPLVSAVLRSPFHRVLSGNTLLLEYRGRRSGRFFRTPVSYCELDGALHCFAGTGHRWWRNLAAGQPVTVVLRGRRLAATATVNTDDHARIADRLGEFLRAVPRDAPHSGVRLDERGEPHAGDLLEAAPGHVHVLLTPSGTDAGPVPQPSR